MNTPFSLGKERGETPSTSFFNGFTSDKLPETYWLKTLQTYDFMIL